MLELSEVLTVSAQLETALAGKTVSAVLPPTKPHKFCWFNGDPALYGEKLIGRRVSCAEGFGIFVELGFEDESRLCFNDGVNPRLVPADRHPNDYQLLIIFKEGEALAFTVAMYGSLILHSGDWDNEYYVRSRESVSPFLPEFGDRFRKALSACKPSMSAKAFLATEQRFPGIGNGTAQDILFTAGINPRRKMGSLDQAEGERLLSSVVTVLWDMTDSGGRNTERDIYGRPGGYRVRMSKNALTAGCPVCGGEVRKEIFLGGSVYYCPACQPLE